MQILNDEIDLILFYHRLKGNLKKVLLLDYDGTLSPFQIRPDRAFPYPGVTKILDMMLDSPDLRTVLVSGRRIDDLIPLLNMERNPEIWGSHGIERLKPDGTYRVVELDKGALEGIRTAKEAVLKKGLAERCEEKPGSIALHWRGMDEQSIRKIKDEIGKDWSGIAQTLGLHLKGFDGGLELRVPGPDKGDVVDTILEETGKEFIAAYLGDDLTDEDAFRAIKQRGIGVLVRKELRPTAADIWIRPPEELLEFMNKWLPED